jgi:hypothetical protein
VAVRDQICGVTFRREAMCRKPRMRVWSGSWRRRVEGKVVCVVRWVWSVLVRSDWVRGGGKLVKNDDEEGGSVGGVGSSDAEERVGSGVDGRLMEGIKDSGSQLQANVCGSQIEKVAW